MATTTVVQRGGAVSAVFGCTGGTSSSRCKCSWPRTSTTPPHGDIRWPGLGGWERVVLHGQVPEHPTPQVAGTQHCVMDVDEVPATGSRPDRLAGVRRRSGSSSTQRTRSLTPRPRCRFLMSLCRSWWSSWTSRCPSRLLKCPRSLLTSSLCNSRYVNRSWRPTPSPALVPAPSRFLRVRMGTVGRRSLDLRGSTGGVWAPPTTSGPLSPSPPPSPLPLHRGLPPGQGGIEILAAATVADVAVVDVPVNMQHKFQQSLFVNPEVLDSVQQQSGGYSSCFTVTGMHSTVVQKTVEIPQLQFLDLVVVPVLCNDKFWYRQCRKTVELPQEQLLWCCGRHCDHTARSSSPSRTFLARFSSTECWTFQMCHRREIPQCSP